jgi:predicted amidohydrolase YtcJ
MRFTIHNDTPIVPSDMIRLIWATVNRLTRSGQVLGEAQRVSALEAIRATTADAAYQYFEEDSKGILAPGMQADLVILSSDPTQVAPEEIIDIEVLETIARGKSVYVK